MASVARVASAESLSQATYMVLVILRTAIASRSLHGLCSVEINDLRTENFVPFDFQARDKSLTRANQ